MRVRTAAELLEALDSASRLITIDGEIADLPPITLPPGVTLRGGTLRFGGAGIRLTADNTLDELTVLAPEPQVAIGLTGTVADLGTLVLTDVHTTGQVALLAENAVRGGHIRIDGLRVERADLRERTLRPAGFGVEAMQGALTLWNLVPGSTLTAQLADVSAGSAEHPVRGSGIFVGGGVRVSRLHTGEIHTDGGIAPGTPDLISGGVFVITGAVVSEVVNAGPVTTYGANDMVLDNWGEVQHWRATAPVTSHGPSGIGFVNFGAIDRLDVTAPIKTTGPGARGFNLYDGTLREATFAGIGTSGDGSVGIQISKPMGSLTVTGDVRTSGGEGLSLVKGVQVPLKAVAVSVKPGGDIGSLVVRGTIATRGSDVASVEIDGHVGHFETGSITAMRASAVLG
ncbi:hypothetical protein D5S17_18980 [Pseudonocardiaceae bacterium YIM PH 21723]|nr:hypothetical protein D5S17_18980 [Pseudonocardiaceae bacterium YIM PH 21723]